MRQPRHFEPPGTEWGGEMPRLTRKSCLESRTTGQRQNRRHVDEKAPIFMFLSALHSPSLRHCFFVTLVIQTQLGSAEPRGKLRPHGLATSDYDTRLSLQPSDYPRYRSISFTISLWLTGRTYFYLFICGIIQVSIT